MKSIQHVLWRGALALSLMAIGIGSGIGMPPVEQAASPDDCSAAPRALVAGEFHTPPGDASGATVMVLAPRA